MEDNGLYRFNNYLDYLKVCVHTQLIIRMLLGCPLMVGLARVELGLGLGLGLDIGHC